ncbi:F-box protein [Raphanus sativus]|uniref:F-box protein At1g47730 n=1 Tax=Raphanus sativus TaxID=3726 RepID=A0A6J0MP08_RAPSA|nr:putative F-box protein At1g47730 [Raphanus sativus]KAJ4916746.1 F-box protein [Raphanus sativus]
MIKKRRLLERPREDESQPSDIPHELTMEILSRFSVKSIVRFGCVSKLWSSLTRLPGFNNLFMSSRKPRLLVTFSTGLKQYGILFPQHQNPDGSYPPFYSFHINNINEPTYALSKSVWGLILLPGFKIWNPTVRRFSALPHPNEHIPTENCKSFLGYDPLEGKHKVLCILHSEDVRVLTLGAQESWRILTKGIPKHHPRGYGRCFNGILYYKACLLDDDKNIIMSFDVKSESFSPIKHPKDLSFDMIPYKGRLALVTYEYNLSKVDIYILEDADGHEWTRQSFLNIICKSKLRGNPVVFKGITDDGELVFTPSTLSESYCILYFDPSKNSTREALFEGVMGETRRCCGIATKYMHIIDVFPNHIDSLVSL